jgi:erythrin-vacuolar iron transport family protein
MLARTRDRRDQRSFLLQRAQPSMTGLIDGSLSTLAPIFAVALVTHDPHDAFLTGLATAIGAGVSMAFSEGLSDTGELTGRGSPYLRGVITGSGTFLARRNSARGGSAVRGGLGSGRYAVVAGVGAWVRLV